MELKLALLLFLAKSSFSQNLLANPDFEEPYSGADWQSWSSTVTQYGLDSYTGSNSYKISNARFQWSSILQPLTLTPHTSYTVYVMVKLLSQTAPSGENVDIRFIYQDSPDCLDKYDLRGRIVNLTMAQGWQRIHADFRTGADMSNIRLNIRSSPNIDFLVDSAYMVEVTNLLANPGFEAPPTGSDWNTWAATITQYDGDSFSGRYSYKVTNARQPWSSIRQEVDVQPDTLYSVSVMVKLLNQSDHVLGEHMDLHFVYEEADEDGEENTVYKTRGTLPNLRVEQGWQELSGDIYIEPGVSSVAVNVRSSPYIMFLVDAANMSVVPADPDWRQAAQTRIEQLRKSDVNINLKVRRAYNRSSLDNLQLRVKQKTHDFPFGSTVSHNAISGDEAENEKYREVFFSNFNWAVIENKLKWKFMEWNQGTVTYPDESISLLNERGVPVRGHTVFWGVEENVPDWLEDLSKTEVLDELKRRIDYLVPYYNESLVHWDVNNEQEHGKWFEEHLEDPYILDWMFTEVHKRATTTPLFLNDFNILSGGTVLQSYVNTAQGLLSRNVPVHKLGIQGHFPRPPNIHQVLYRLDVASSSGLPIWITELDVMADDRTERADSYDDLVTCFFGHPAVEGILLWGFVDTHHWRPQAALFEGSEFTPNEAGLRWQHMLNERWRTDELLQVNERRQTFNLRGFHGIYDIEVIYKGEVIQKEEFHLESGSDMTVAVRVLLPQTVFTGADPDI